MVEDVLRRLGLTEVQSAVCGREWTAAPTGGEIVSVNPATGKPLGAALTASREDYETVAASAVECFRTWRMTPPPARGEFVRRMGEALRAYKFDLGLLVSLETGKIRSEGLGEVQEMIDMCDFAVGLSRQLYGLTIASERPGHRMFEQWHPLGPVGVLTAFNFPVAVWSWNAMIAAVCGDPCVWKPSPRTPLTAVAVQRIACQVARELDAPGVFCLCAGEADDVGRWMIGDRRFPLISATGSCDMGRRVAPAVAARLGRTLLELGGNNAAILTRCADLELALRAIVFAAVGTAGQRCTTLRRLFVHEQVADDFLARLQRAYASVRIGDPMDESTLMGPLISEQAVLAMMNALDEARRQGAEVLYGGRRLERDGYFVEPTIVRASHDAPVVRRETFAPILYVIPYRDLDEAIAWQNDVEQGLSSAIFTDSVREAEQFLSARGSDCGIANVNIGTSGAEIGGAFGGEKDSGGGREAGSDAWKIYMRRQTCTINGSSQLPLAQGVQFDVS